MTHLKTISELCDVDRTRERTEPHSEPTETADWLSKAVGKRYCECTLAAFVIRPEHRHDMMKAVGQCRDYVQHFRDHIQRGRSIVFVGPKGAGKDHLMVAVLRAIVTGYGVSNHRVRYTDGLTLYREFRDAIKRNEPESLLVESLARPDLLAISDPLPPTGGLSEYEQRMLIQIVDRRYRECLPMAATLNVQGRGELEKRIGAQITDRLMDSQTVIVKCNWPSFRSEAAK